MTRTTRWLIGAAILVAVMLLAPQLGHGWATHTGAPSLLGLGLAVAWDVGAQLTTKIGNVPVAASAGTRNGAAIDRQGFLSAVISATCGAATGTPTSFTYDAKVQDSADGSTGWADYKPDGATVAAITQITAVNTNGRRNVNLVNAKRYIRVVETVAFVGGTSPTLAVAEDVILGGASEEPPA